MARCKSQAPIEANSVERSAVSGSKRREDSCARGDPEAREAVLPPRDTLTR